MKRVLGYLANVMGTAGLVSAIVTAVVMWMTTDYGMFSPWFVAFWTWLMISLFSTAILLLSDAVTGITKRRLTPPK